MNYKKELILNEYENSRQDFVNLGDYVIQIIDKIIDDNNIMVMSVEHRVKTKESLAGKLAKKDGKYHKLTDITDILGVRIISYFSDDLDRISTEIENRFKVDWENSVDKRAKLNPTAFGYLSIHYICSLRDDEAVGEQLKNKKFEIQIRSTLQHVWAEIEHDLGYKSEFAIPKCIRRDFSRVAGLLEIADEKFVYIRDGLQNYGEEVRIKIANNDVRDIPIDLISLKEYMLKNCAMRSFLNDIAAICNAEISDITPEAYLPQLIWLDIKSLEDISKMLTNNRETALKLANNALGHTELDILKSNVGLRYLCQAELIKRKYSLDKIEEFIKISISDKERAARQAKKLFENIDEI